MNAKLRTLIESIQSTVADYRADEGFSLDADHVELWVKQFDSGIRVDILQEMDHILKKTYFSKRRVARFLRSVARSKDLSKGDLPTFWKKTGILKNQNRGNSQREMLPILSEELSKAVGFGIDDCPSEASNFIYLDDAIFSGQHVVNDFRPWIAKDAPKKANVNIIVIAYHTGGKYYSKKALEEMATEAGKKIDFTFWCSAVYENRSNANGDVDVLRPRVLPEDDNTKKFIEEFGQNGKLGLLRSAKDPNSSKIFSSEESRNMLEQAFWLKGLEIRDMCPLLKPMHRPLGYTSTNSSNKIGFGAMFVTYRNCPNNCPLAVWAGEPWHPLLERKPN